MKNVVEQSVGAAAPGMAADDEAGTRDRVARSILEQGPSTAADLADRLNLTPAAIRRHLGVLTEQGHIEPREQRVYGQRGRGRPAKVFVLTDAGRANFYQAYDELAIQALRQLISAAGPAAVDALAQQRVADVEAAYHRIRAERPQANPVDVLAEALNGDGYVASVKPSQVRGLGVVGEQLCQHHCPVAHVAEQFPQLCEAETQLFSKLLGSHVQRLATIAHGDGVCTTNIPLLQQGGTTPLEPPVPSRAPASAGSGLRSGTEGGAIPSEATLERSMQLDPPARRTASDVLAGSDDADGASPDSLRSSTPTAPGHTPLLQQPTELDPTATNRKVDR